jgi:hypothetical protein
VREKTKKVLWVVLAIVGVAVMAVTLAWIPFLVPQHQTQMETSSRLLAGLAIGVGLFVAWRRSVAAEKVAEASLKNAETALKGAQVTVQAQESERFIEATRMLGDENLRVRIGGIYTLESLARYSEDEEQQVAVFEVLCAFIREVRPLPDPEDDDSREMGQDVKVAIEAIRRREQVPGEHIDLSNTDLRDGNLNHAKLQGAKLQGANLQGAHLQGANLQRAKLQHAHLWGAHLQGANLRGANLLATALQRADLQRADLQGADLRATALQEAALQGAALQGARLLGARLQGARLQGAALQGAHLHRAKGLTQLDLDLAKGDHTTELPEGLEYPANWPE